MTYFFILAFLTFSYTAFIVVLFIGLRRLKPLGDARNKPFVSVVIAARNEEENITPLFNSILRQSYPRDRFEVILVDDHSTDNTRSLVLAYAQQYNFIKLISLQEAIGKISPKKLAIAGGIAASQGEIILTTDADCILPEKWIEVMVAHFTKGVGAVMSWVETIEDGSLLSKVVSLDSFALVAVGAGAAGLGFPFLANGANFGYRKKVFGQVNGFSGIDQFASGDDDLFLLKMLRHRQWQVAFVLSPQARVRTQAPNSLRLFLSQRVRWASKGAIYPLPLKIVELAIYSYYLLLALSIPAWLLFSFAPWPAIASFFIKSSGDFFFLRQGCKLAGRPLRPVVFLLSEIFQIFYILPVGIIGTVGNFKWKGRTYAHGKAAKNDLK